MKTVFVVLVAEIYTLVVRTGVTNPQLFNKVPGPSGPDLETWGCGHVYIYILYIMVPLSAAILLGCMHITE